METSAATRTYAEIKTAAHFALLEGELPAAQFVTRLAIRHARGAFAQQLILRPSLDVARNERVFPSRQRPGLGSA